MGKKRTRNPRGTVALDKRANGDHVWLYRWKDETGKHRSVIFGTVREFRNGTLAWNEAERLKLPEKYLLPVRNAQKGPTFDLLIERYRQEKMPTRFSTRHAYENWLLKHIKPKWGATQLADLDPGEVELWLSDLNLAPKSKGHIRGLLAILVVQAMKWKLLAIGRNPMELVTVKGGSKRRSRPRVLTQRQFAKLVGCIEEDHVRVIVMVSMCLGLRFSEVLALQWSDIDWRGRLISISRGIVQGRIGPVKTEYSDAPAPLDPALARILRDWKGKADRTDPGVWVFGSPFKGFTQPYFPTAVRRHIQAAAAKAELGEMLKGEPTKVFRHSYRAWLGTTNTPIAVIKDLMRHADIRTAFNVYGNGLEQPMRGANSKVVRMAVRAS